MKSDFAKEHGKWHCRGDKLPDGISLDMTAPTCRRWLPSDFAAAEEDD